jgi:folate-binding protein YgfZ
MPLISDLSARARFRLTGSDRVRFLHGMVTNDVERLRAGEGCHAAMLSVKGKTLGDLIIYADEEQLLIELDAESRERVRDDLLRHLIIDDVELTDLTDELAELGIYGEDAAAALEACFGKNLTGLLPYHHVLAGPIRIARNDWLSLPGFHLFGRTADLDSISGTPLSAEEREVLRVEAGTPRYGVDIDEDRLILEAGFADAISFDKGCYLGQEVVARATARGHINRKLMGLLLEGSKPAPPGTALHASARPEAGTITSSVFSRRLGRAIALGYVHRTVFSPGTVLTTAEEPPRTAIVTALPF